MSINNQSAELLQQLLEKEEYQTIINDPELFWCLYCSIQREKMIPCGHYALLNNKFEKGMLDSVLKKIEFVRNSILQYLEKGKNKMYYFYHSRNGNPIDGTEGLCELKNHDQDITLDGYYFIEYISRFMQTLTKSLGFDCRIETWGRGEGKMCNEITFSGMPKNYLASSL